MTTSPRWNQGLTRTVFSLGLVLILILAMSISVYGEDAAPPGDSVATSEIQEELAQPWDYFVESFEQGLLRIPYYPKHVKAGFYPDGIFHINDLNGFIAVPDEQKSIAWELARRSGIGTEVDDFLLGGIDFLGGKCPLAFLLDDLRKQGVNIADVTDLTNNERDKVQLALLKMFHIDVQTPGYKSKFPRQVNLQIKYTNFEPVATVEGAIEMVAKRNEPGIYRIRSPRKAAETLSLLEQVVYDEVKRLSGATEIVLGEGELEFLRLTGFDEATLQVEDMPPVRGVVLTHKIYFGSHQVEYGWQWFGRSNGLHQAQVGFLTP